MRAKYLAALLALLLVGSACAPGGGTETTVSAEPSPQTTAPAGTEGEQEEPSEDDGSAEEGSSEAIRIGVLAPTTGNVASPGMALVEGFEMFWEDHGTEVAGRPVELFVEDTAGDPDTGVNKAQLLVEQREVDLLIGGLLANVGLAVANYVTTETEVPYLIPVVAEDDLTQRNIHPQILRVAGFTASQFYHPAGAWAAEEGIESAITIANDFAFGYQTSAGFVNPFTDGGGEILDQLWVPLGTQDFGPYLADIQSQEPDAVFAMTTGGDALRLVQQWQEFGLRDSDIRLIGTEQLLDQSLLPAQDAAAEGLELFGRFPTAQEAPETAEFVQAYEERYDELPTNNAAAMYTAGMWIVSALEELDGEIPDAEGFRDAILGVELESTPFGQMVMDEYGNPVFNIYRMEIQRRDDGQLWSVPIETFEQVSQFWTYDPEEFLDHPPYSREYQGDGVWPEPNPEGG